MRMRYRVLPAALCIVLARAPALAEEWGTNMSRQQALAQLHSASSTERREGLGRLAEIGTREDVPFMLQRLHDHDELVRGMAEEALWGLWLQREKEEELLFRGEQYRLAIERSGCAATIAW